jgi:hypothetical protein
MIIMYTKYLWKNSLKNQLILIIECNLYDNIKNIK